MQRRMNRRDFFVSIGVAGASAAAPLAAPPARFNRQVQTGGNDRERWVTLMRRLADPVLTNLAAGTLKSRMPVEQAAGAHREHVTHLEALGRLVAGIAPWVELGPDGTAEGRLR